MTVTFEEYSPTHDFFDYRSDEDGNIMVRVFPERKEILIRRFGLSGVALYRVGAGEPI